MILHALLARAARHMQINLIPKDAVSQGVLESPTTMAVTILFDHIYTDIKYYSVRGTDPCH